MSGPPQHDAILSPGVARRMLDERERIAQLETELAAHERRDAYRRERAEITAALVTDLLTAALDQRQPSRPLATALNALLAHRGHPLALRG